MKDRLIITGASAGYQTSLLSLLGSINCNWPNHPDVLVYDLGLPEAVLRLLDEHRIEVRKIPDFAPHWRMDYTWKPWCFNNAPARTYLWLDAGACVLRSMDEAFMAAERLGYFAVSLYNHPVGPSVPPPLLGNLGLDQAAVAEMISISSGIHAICKRGGGEKLVEEAFSLCLDHDNMRATQAAHRHDQALLTLLLNKYFGSPVLADYHIYAHHYPTGPGAESRQKVWVHRRKMLDEDSRYFAKYLSVPGPIRRPTDYKRPLPPSMVMRARIAIAKIRGRYPGDDIVKIDKVISHGLKD